MQHSALSTVLVYVCGGEEGVVLVVVRAVLLFRFGSEEVPAVDGVVVVTSFSFLSSSNLDSIIPVDV